MQLPNCGHILSFNKGKEGNHSHFRAHRAAMAPMGQGTFTHSCSGKVTTHGPRGQSIEPEATSPALKLKSLSCPFFHLWGPVTLSFVPVPPLWNGNVCPVLVMLLCLGGTQPDFTDSQLERNPP